MSQSSYPLVNQEDILRLISDPCARKIIYSIQTESKSAIQLSNELDAELCTIYRRLHKFQKYGLLRISFRITPNGKKSFYYQSKINSIMARYHHGKFDVVLDFSQI